jgi:hypothetical protein
VQKAPQCRRCSSSASGLRSERANFPGLAQPMREVVDRGGSRKNVQLATELDFAGVRAPARGGSVVCPGHITAAGHWPTKSMESRRLRRRYPITPPIGASATTRLIPAGPTSRAGQTAGPQGSGVVYGVRITRRSRCTANPPRNRRPCRSASRAGQHQPRGPCGQQG